MLCLRNFLIKKEKEMESNNNEGLLSESSSDDEGWDTDLEDCCEKPRSNIIPLEQMYLTACGELGVSPVAKFIKQMKSTKVFCSNPVLYHLSLFVKGTVSQQKYRVFMILAGISLIFSEIGR